MSRLIGQVALVTGASSGIGKSIALAFASEGANVALVSRNAEALAHVEEEVRAHGVKALACPADITDLPAIDRLLNGVMSHFNRLDILVNNAGRNITKRSLAVVTTEDWQTVIDLNLTAAFALTRAALPLMRAQGHGTIINISSLAGKVPMVQPGAAYCASKAALISLNSSINLEERQYGIRACVICPGEVNTPIVDKRPFVPPADVRARMLQPEDVAAAALFAASLPPRATVEEIIIQPTVQRNIDADVIAGQGIVRKDK